MSEETTMVEGGEGNQLDPGIEAEAREQGWVPLEEYHGPQDEWQDAETFVKRGREINPILRKALKKERERTAALEAELRNTGATVAELREYLAKVEERATANALASLKKAKKDALANGDMESAAEYDDQIDRLKDSASAVPALKKPAAVPNPQEVHPEIKAWLAQSPWFSDENPEMVDYAKGVAATLTVQMNARGTPWSPNDILPTVTQRVKKMFPRYFQRGDEPVAGMFESGGSSSGSARSASGGSGKKTGFSTLPDDAKQQFKRFYDAGYYVDTKTGKKLDLAAAQAEYFSEYE